MLFIVIDPAHQIVKSNLSEQDLPSAGQYEVSVFYPENPDLAPFFCRAERIVTGSTTRIPALLASSYGGAISVCKNRQQQRIPENSVYRIVLRPNESSTFPGILRGKLKLETNGISVLEKNLASGG